MNLKEEQAAEMERWAQQSHGLSPYWRRMVPMLLQERREMRAEVERLKAELAAEREACAELADDHDCHTWPESCDCRGKIAAAIRARAKEVQRD